jgi:hypothetical protein
LEGAIVGANVMGGASRSFTVAGRKPFDVIDLLPAPAEHKLLDLRQQLADARAVAHAAAESANDARVIAMEAARRLRDVTTRLTYHTRGFGRAGSNPIEGHPEFATAKEAADRTAAEVARLSELSEARAFRAQTLGQLVSSVEAWLKVNAGPFEVVDAPTPKLRKGATAFEGIEAARSRLAELQADLQATRVAPIPSSKAKAIARAEIERLATAGAPDVFPLVESGQPIIWPTMKASVSAWREGRPDPFTPIVKTTDSVSLLAFLFRDQMIAALEAEIDARADDAHALGDKERAEREAELLASILQTEREEESLIDVANEVGGTVLRRPDADARAVLGIASTDAPGESDG